MPHAAMSEQPTAPMPAPRARWKERDAPAGLVEAIARATGVVEPVARVLVGRGIASVEAARAFLAPTLRELPDPMRLAGIDAALDRVLFAIDKREQIGVFGDYDVDGVTSTVLLVEFLERLGAAVTCTIPDRLVEGYGLSRAGVDRLAAAGCRLIITVDCGVTAHEEVDYAAQQGIDVVVIDHHTVPVALPRAISVINPHRIDCTRGSEMLCAVGVTFNLALALRRRLRESGFFSTLRPEPDLKDSLDLVALGTVADVVPLVGENRILVSHGVRLMRQGKRPGLRALLDVAHVDLAKVDAADLGFQLGPRINAAGRLGDAIHGVRLLRATSVEDARGLAVRLDQENLARRELEKKITEDAIRQVERSDLLRRAKAIVVGDESWHPGVVGIVAARLVERFARPAVVIGEGGRGSGRSVERFHLYEGLQATASTLAGFGGHAHAAGVRLPPGGLDAFRTSFLAHAEAVLSEDDLHKVAVHDGDLPVAALSLDLVHKLQQLAPFGRKNPEPSFVFRSVTPVGVKVLTGGHLKGFVDGRGAGAGAGLIELIAFGAGERASEFSGILDILATPERNEWRGTASLQLRVRDFRRAA